MMDQIAVINSIPGGYYSLAGLVVVVACASFGLFFVSRFRALRAATGRELPVDVAGRYHPMLRLLSEEDFEFVAGNPRLLRSLRTERRRLFRRYLNCLTRDYGRLLEGIRLVMVQSRVDRPDLAHALAKNRVLFALAICRIEFRLALHALGIGTVDISGVVEAFDRLREHAAALASVPVPA